MGLFKPNVEKMHKKKNIRGLVKALSNSDSTVRIDATKALREILQNDKSLRLRLQYYPILELIPDSNALKVSEKKLVESVAAEIRFLNSRTRTVENTYVDTVNHIPGYTNAEDYVITETYEELDPDAIASIKALINLIPPSLIGQIRELSGEAKRLF